MLFDAIEYGGVQDKAIRLYLLFDFCGLRVDTGSVSTEVSSAYPEVTDSAETCCFFQ